MERKNWYNMSVVFSKEEMYSMENILANFLEKNNICLTVPVDVFKLSTDLGFDVRPALFENPLGGMLLVNEFLDKIPEFKTNKVIVFNDEKSIEDKGFIVAHELAHYIEGREKHGSKKMLLASRDKTDKAYYSNSKDEQRKDYIAAAILMPKSDVEARYPQLKETEKSKLSNEFFEEVSKTYEVSIQTAARRIKEVFYV